MGMREFPRPVGAGVQMGCYPRRVIVLEGSCPMGSFPIGRALS